VPSIATRHLLSIPTLLLALGVPPVSQAGPVRYTEAAEHAVRRSVRLPGNVESRIESVVASEADGLVVAIEFREGDSVRSGQPIVRLRTISHEIRLTEAQGRLQEARARLELAESQLERARRLVRDEIISQEDLDDASSEFSAWEGRRAQSLAEIDQLELTLERCIIRAPFDGVIVRKRTDLGQWINVGGPVAEVVALDKLDVRVEVPENYYTEIVSGIEATVTFEALGDAEIIGRVEEIIPRADPRAHTFPIKVAISNPEKNIGVGMLALVALPLGEPYPAVVVPKDALVRQGTAEIVFRMTDDGTVEPVPVVRGTGVGAWVAVEGPLAPGDRIVTRGNERLRPGQEVEGELQEYPLP